MVSYVCKIDLQCAFSFLFSVRFVVLQTLSNRAIHVIVGVDVCTPSKCMSILQGPYIRKGTWIAYETAIQAAAVQCLRPCLETPKWLRIFWFYNVPHIFRFFLFSSFSHFLAQIALSDNAAGLDKLLLS